MNDSPGQFLVVTEDAPADGGLAEQLGQQGYAVTRAAEANLALDLVKSQPFDLVFLDLDLSDSVAYTVLTFLKGSGELSALPVIVFTATGKTDEVEKFLDLGADDYLHAPFTPRLVKARVEASLEKKRLRTEQIAYLQEDAELVKIEHDLQVARRIQAGFLPSQLPQPPGWEIAAGFQPAREVAGDFYDAFMLSQNRRIGFVIADVVDKGIPAALFMSLVRSLTRAFAQQHYSLSWAGMLDDRAPARPGRTQKRERTLPSTGTVALQNAVLLTNNYIIDNHMQDNMFATLFFGMIDPITGHLAYINAGHNPPFLIGADGTVKAKLTSSGPAVGMLPGVDFRIDYAQFAPGDVLFAYTDGVTEARDPANQLFTEARLLALLAQPVDSINVLLEQVESTLKRYIDTATQFDDITMIAVRRQPDCASS